MFRPTDGAALIFIFIEVGVLFYEIFLPPYAAAGNRTKDRVEPSMGTLILPTEQLWPWHFKSIIAIDT